MGKKLGTLSILLCLFGGVLVFPVSSHADDKYALLTVRYAGNFDKVYVFVNTVASGEVAQNQAITLRLSGDTHYQITLRRDDAEETKSVYLAKDLQRQLVFYGPNRPE